MALKALRDLDNPVLVPHPQFYFSHAVFFGLLNLAFLLTGLSHTLFPPIGALPFSLAPTPSCRHTHPPPLQNTLPQFTTLRKPPPLRGWLGSLFWGPSKPTLPPLPGKMQHTPAEIGGEQYFPTLSFCPRACWEMRPSVATFMQCSSSP